MKLCGAEFEEASLGKANSELRHITADATEELKIGKFLPEYVGKMQFYLAALDKTIREEGENPSIGIILCKDKKRTIVEYALKESNKPIAVARYRMTATLPINLRKELPAPGQIRKLFDEIDQ